MLHVTVFRKVTSKFFEEILNFIYLTKIRFDIVTNGKMKGCKYFRNASWGETERHVGLGILVDHIFMGGGYFFP